MSDSDEEIAHGVKKVQRALESIKAELNVPIAVGPTGTGPADPPCAFHRGTILVGREEGDWLCQSPDSPLREFGDPTIGRAARSGLVRVHLGAATDEELMRVGVMEPDTDVRMALDRIRAIPRRRPIAAAPNHVIGITNGSVCPADEPSPTTDPPCVRGVTPAPPGHRRPRVLVIDTGLIADFRLQLGGGISGAGRKDEIERGPDGTEFIREYVGHGTFIAGLLAAAAPTADIFVSNALPKIGAAFEDEFGDSLFTAIKEFQAQFAEEHDAWPDIISLSAGTTLYYDPQHPSTGHENGLLALKSFMDTLKTKPTLLVAAAGNNGNSIRFHPAALAEQAEFSDAVVSVGALREDPDHGRTCFSDFGPWVKVFAPGERLVSGFSARPRKLQYQHATFDQCQYLAPPDAYRCACQAPAHGGALSAIPENSVADFTTTHKARWSGTSFATPLVAGYIAQRMALENRADARGVYAGMRKTMGTIDVAGEPALKVIPHGFVVPPMAL